MPDTAQTVLDKFAAFLDETNLPGLPQELLDDVRAWTDDVRTLPDGSFVVRIRPAPYTDTEKDEAPEGVTVKWCEDTYDDGKPMRYAEWTLPTLGETFYGSPRDLVVKMGRKTFQVSRRFAHCEGRSTKYGPPLPLKGCDLLQFRLMPARTETKAARGSAQIFGQPVFHQDEAFPSHGGRSAFLLWSEETNQGDSGQGNMFIALDEYGVPCRAWYEHSSC